MSKKNESKEIQTLVAGVSEERPDWVQKGAAGSENVTTADMILPRIDIIQAISPQLKSRDPAYIPGAEQGDIYNTVTGEIYGKEVTFIPVMFRKEWVIWKLRKFGGGLVDVFDNPADAKRAFELMPNRQQMDNGQMVEAFEIVESHQHFALLMTPTGIQQAVFSLTKSKIKVSRALNTLVQLADVDRFAKAYKFNSVEDKNEKGEFWTFKAHPVGYVTKDMYDAGKMLYEAIKAGLADVDRSTGTEGDQSSGPVHDSSEL
jgi:hypothetical protein